MAWDLHPAVVHQSDALRASPMRLIEQLVNWGRSASCNAPAASAVYPAVYPKVYLPPTFWDKPLKKLERVSGIEPPSSAWKAVALPLSYTRESQTNPTRIRRLCHFRREPNDFNKIS
jgi:hypothetical protein